MEGLGDRIWMRLFLLLLSLSGIRSSSSCSPDKFVAYKVLLSTYWEPELFPKQYPEWRPPAQWSKVIGFSHNDNYNLFKVGSVASDSVKEFAETGSTESLDKVSDSLILDVFSAPPILQGAGNTQGSIFLDGNHTKVSLMSKLVPSPDWFIGLDSLELCKDGRFIESIVIESDPMDAGSDNGFTFTSPNWPTEPRGEIFKITNTYPSHPAGSFNYPELSSLPTIATFSLVKEREYELSEDFTLNLASMIANHQQHHSESQKGNKQVNRTKKEIDRDGSPYLYTPADESVKMDDSVTLAFVEKKEEEITQRPTTATTTQETHKPKSTSSSRRPKKIQESEWNQILKDEILKGKRLRRNRTDRKKDRMKSFRNRSGGGYHASMGPKAFLKKRYRSKFLNEAQEKIFELDADKKDELYQKILNSYNSSKTSKKMRRKLRRMRRKHAHRGPRNCRVSEWGDWGPCSKTCGIGEAVRTRTIEVKPKRGGKPCPGLKSVKWCGSARNCAGKYFDW